MLMRKNNIVTVYDPDKAHHTSRVAALGNPFSNRFLMCSSSIVLSVRVIVWFV